MCAPHLDTDERVMVTVMAWYWNLAACLPDHEDADLFDDFFRKKRIPLPFGEVPLEVTVHQAHESVLVGLWPERVSLGIPSSDPRLTAKPARAAVVAWADAQLAEAPPFDAAFFGAEAFDGFIERILYDNLIIDSRQTRE